MNMRSFILASGLFALASCSSYEYEGSDIYAILKGKVTDEAGAPVEHLEVSIELSRRDVKTYYTSSDGTFICDITYREARNLKKIALTLTDIDGEENGGLFATHSEDIHLYDELGTEVPMILNLDFHCSRANL